MSNKTQNVWCGIICLGLISMTILAIFSQIAKADRTDKTNPLSNRGWIELDKCRIKKEHIICYYEAKYNPYISSVIQEKMTDAEKAELGKMGTHILFDSGEKLETTDSFKLISEKMRQE